MIILPSLLEYSVESLNEKLQTVIHNKYKFYDLTHQEPPGFHFHLDFVLSQFAKDRSVMESLSIFWVFEILEKYFSDQKLTLTIHLMGEVEDMFSAYRFFESFTFNSNWQYIFLVPENFAHTWTNSSFTFLNNSLIDIGVWYDLGTWDHGKELFTEITNILIMTVVAGKSGQVLTPDIKKQSLSLAKANPKRMFILDGGWDIHEKISGSNLSIVSYSSFWNSFRS